MFIADCLIVTGTLCCLLPGRVFIVADKVSNGLEITVIHTLIQRASVLLQSGSFSSAGRECNISPRWIERTFFQSDVAKWEEKKPNTTESVSLTWLLVAWSPCEWEKQWINIILMYQSEPSYQGGSTGDSTAAPVNMTLSNMISGQLFPSSPSDNTHLI